MSQRCEATIDEALRLIDLLGDNKLVLCGDYIYGGEGNYGVLDRIMELERRYGTDKAIVLAGNHEDMACDGCWLIGKENWRSVMYFIFRIRGICKIHEKTYYDRELLRNNLLVIQQAIEDGVQTTAEQFQKLSNLEKLDMLDYIAEASL